MQQSKELFDFTQFSIFKKWLEILDFGFFPKLGHIGIKNKNFLIFPQKDPKYNKNVFEVV